MNVSNMELYHAQDGRCFYCGVPMAPVRSNCYHRLGWTVDHFLPKARGNTRYNNKVLCHFRCNLAKGNRMPSPEEVRRFQKLMDNLRHRHEVVCRLEARLAEKARQQERNQYVQG